ncbi:FecR family protein [Pedobacter frigoris]|uniref:FecR family protein n=1 Tax=Pedobacter frigoris TaxID=2571272 RepID=UPI00292CDD60|nr:FecR domain-containing protein [Pedobacter frigoris]
MNEKEFTKLLERYSKGECTGSEKSQIENWLTFGHFGGRTLSEQQLDNRLDKLARRLQLHQKPYKLWLRLAGAAAILIVMGTWLSYYQIKTSEKKQEPLVKYVQDVLPGKVGATLTLANGKKIRLSDAVNGELVKESGIVVSKSSDGQLIYEFKGQDTDPNQIHTLSTGRGETYNLRLPDGSLVYLNAGSSLTYAASLIEHGKRVVRLQGEGYFEINKDKKHPFVVQTGKHEVEVLGTHFNVMSYPDEPGIKTTLLEGRVKVSKEGASAILAQGQESVYNGTSFSVKKVNAEDAIAWKNGFFLFDDNDVEMAMRKIALWYDVEVIYQGKFKELYVGGRISRTKTLKELIQILESTKKIKIKLEGRVLTVMQ